MKDLVEACSRAFRDRRSRLARMFFSKVSGFEKNRKILKRAFDKSENGAKLNAMLKIERCDRIRFAMLILKRL